VDAKRCDISDWRCSKNTQNRSITYYPSRLFQQIPLEIVRREREQTGFIEVPDHLAQTIPGAIGRSVSRGLSRATAVAIFQSLTQGQLLAITVTGPQSDRPI